MPHLAPVSKQQDVGVRRENMSLNKLTKPHLTLGYPALLGPAARGYPWRVHGHTGGRTTTCSPDTWWVRSAADCLVPGRSAGRPWDSCMWHRRKREWRNDHDGHCG